MAIPTKHREKLQMHGGGQLVITVDVTRCLLIYPLPVWEDDIEPNIANLPGSHPAARDLQRLLLGNAEDCAMDTQGRVLLPATLRKFAKLDKRAVLVGQPKKFELWDEQTWQDRLEQLIDESVDHVGGLLSPGSGLADAVTY